jgi:hypothetical protein
MRRPHKHAEIIKAWADGADVQYYDPLSKEWCDIREQPHWFYDSTFRIKPETKPDTEYWCRTYEHSGGSIFTPHLLSPTEIQPANIKLTFDGETGKLKKAEVL